MVPKFGTFLGYQDHCKKSSNLHLQMPLKSVFQDLKATLLTQKYIGWQIEHYQLKCASTGMLCRFINYLTLKPLKMNSYTSFIFGATK